MYSRRRFGLATMLPGLLQSSGYSAAVHATLDDGVYPQTTANNMRWEGDDGATIDALAAPPLLAAAEESFLNVGVQIGELIDANNYATLLLVHWPGETGPSYQDLVNGHKFGTVLGQFVTLDDYFQQCADPGYTQNYSADDYRDPYLEQLGQASATNPISRFVDFWKLQTELLALSGLKAMKACFKAQSASEENAQRDSSGHEALARSPRDLLERVAELTEVQPASESIELNSG